MATCPACGLPQSPGKKFCGACGAAVREAEASTATSNEASVHATPTAPPACGNCGRPAATSAKFCKFCGTPITAAGVTPAREWRQDAEVTASPLSPRPAVAAAPPPRTPHQPVGSKARTIWIAAGTLVLAIAVAAAWWLTRTPGGSNDNSRVAVEGQAPAPATNISEPAAPAASEALPAPAPAEQQQRVELDRAEDLARQRLAEAQRDADRIRRDAQLEAERQQALAREAEAARIATEREQLRLQAERDVQAKAEAERRQAEEQAKRQEQAAETATMLATLPTRTELDVRLMAPLNSGRVKAEDRFEAATVEDVLVKGRVVIPAGSVMRGIVASVEPATRTNRTAKMVLTFDQLTINNASYPIRGTVTRLLEGPGLKGETKRIAAGGAVGAIIGGILGGAKGAIAGLGIGAGGTIAATEGKEIDLADGSILRVRLERVQTR